MPLRGDSPFLPMPEGRGFTEILMTIDERIEALTQSLELVARMQQDNDVRWNGRFEKLLEMSERTDRRMEVILNLIQGHEQRLNRLEGGE
jgi:hypothetical protein